LQALGQQYRDRPEAQATIIEATTDPDPSARMMSVAVFAWYLSDRNAAVPKPILDALFARLEDEATAVRAQAAWCFIHLGGEAVRPAVPILIRGLADPDISLRINCAEALGAVGLEAEEARPALRALDDDDVERAVRGAARKALIAIDEASRTFHEKTFPGLLAGLRDDYAEVRAVAAAGLADHGPRSAPAVPDLIRALDDPDPRVRRASATALGAIGPGASAAVDRLRALAVGDDDEPARRAAAAALAAIGPATPSAD
jgi:HEAT repeat protein